MGKSSFPQTSIFINRRTSTRETTPCCLKFQTAGEGEFCGWWTAEILRTPTASWETDFCCAKGTRLRGWAGSLISRRKDKNCGFLLRSLMIREARKFADWCVLILRQRKE